MEEIALWVQIAAVLAAVVASIVALSIAGSDRRNARRIAADDRRLSHLMFDLDLLVRLLENYNRGGSIDSDEASRMGAEALTLVGALGPDRLPDAWAEKVEGEEMLLATLSDPAFPDYKKDAIRVQLSLLEVSREIRRIVESKG